MTDNTDSTMAVAGIGVFNKSIVPLEHLNHGITKGPNSTFFQNPGYACFLYYWSQALELCGRSVPSAHFK
jgi:hypothetical protein